MFAGEVIGIAYAQWVGNIVADAVAARVGQYRGLESQHCDVEV